MTKIFKSRLFLVFITSIICISGTVTATTLYFANQVSYIPKDTSWKVANVEDALNSLFTMNFELNKLKQLGDATDADILKGKIAVVKGELVTGSYNSNKTFQLRISGSINNLGNGSATAYIDNVGTVSVNFKKPSASGSSTGFNSDTVTVTLAN